MDGTSHGLTLIKEWCIPWVGQVKRKRAGGKIGIVIGKYQLV
jgi:hypothetical protein